MQDDGTVGSVEGVIGRKVGRGLRWSLVGVMVTKLASFAIGLVLARLLAPNDFGVYALALAATAFVIHVNDVGIIAATVQWRGRLEDMAPTAATVAFATSMAVYGAVWVSAPWFCSLASSPEATPVVRLLTAVIVVDGITAVRSAALMRRFEQDKLTLANLTGFLVQAPLAILLAVGGAGAYSFAGAQLAGAVVTGIVVLIVAKLPFEIGFDPTTARALMRFGLPLAASLGVESILVNADYVIVGRLLGDVALGFYLLAFNVSSWVPGIVTTGVRYVSVAGFSRLAEQEGELASGVRRSVPLMVALVLPIAAVVSVLSPALVSTLYGATWAPAAPVLRLLMILMCVRVLTSFAFDILTSVGATRATFWLNLGWAVVLIPALIVGTRSNGIVGAAGAHAIVAVVVAIPLAVLLMERSKVPIIGVAPALVRPVIAGAVAAAVCWLVSRLSSGVPAVELVAAGAAGLLAYLLVLLPRRTLSRYARTAGRVLGTTGVRDSAVIGSREGA